jgi:dTDP-glucose 4,6-dehydratase
MTRKVAVIGSNSFSGSDFIDLMLADPGTEVLGLSRSPEKSRIYLPYLNSDLERFTFQQADLNHDMNEIMSSLDEFCPDYIVNFAAQSEVGPSWIHPEHWFETNTVSLARLINALKDRDYLKRYVHISSPEVYGNTVGLITEATPVNPSTPYAASKAAADLLISTYVANFGFPAVTVRATNVYGAHQQLFKIIPRSFIYLKLDRTVQLHGGGEAIKSYIHIRDVSEGEELIMENGSIGEIYHLSPSRGHSIREIVEKICALKGRTLKQATQDIGERLGQDAAYVISSDKAETALDWSAGRSLEQGLREVSTWIDTYWDVIQNEPLEYVHKP